MLFTHIPNAGEGIIPTTGVYLLRSCKMQIYINLHIHTHIYIFTDIHTSLIWPLVCGIFHAHTHTLTPDFHWIIYGLWLTSFVTFTIKFFIAVSSVENLLHTVRECSVILKIGCNIGMFILTYENIHILFHAWPKLLYELWLQFNTNILKLNIGILSWIRDRWLG